MFDRRSAHFQGSHKHNSPGSKQFHQGKQTRGVHYLKKIYQKCRFILLLFWLRALGSIFDSVTPVRMIKLNMVTTLPILKLKGVQKKTLVLIFGCAHISASIHQIFKILVSTPGVYYVG